MGRARIAVIKTNPETVFEDYRKVMEMAEYRAVISKGIETLLKLNLSWSLYFPACSTEPWQLEGVLKTLVGDGYDPKKIYPVENKTVCTKVPLGVKENKWKPVLEKYGFGFISLTDVEWVKYEPKGKMLKLSEIYPDGISIPKMFPGKNIIHLPTVKTHGHSITTGSIKNSFGGLLQEARHYCHKYIHEVLVDLMTIQKEVHPGIFTVMDGTICGDGAGPRTMIPVIKDYIIAGADSVAIDSISAKMMGFDPMRIPYIRMAHEIGLGVGDPTEIDVIGKDISDVNFGFKAKRSLVIATDQFIRKGPLQFAENLLLKSPLMIWAPFASNVYHDYLWYPLVGKKRIREFMKTKWGRVFKNYSS